MDKIKVKMLKETEGVKAKEYHPTLFEKGKVYDIDLSLAKNFEIMKVIEVLSEDYKEEATPGVIKQENEALANELSELSDNLSKKEQKLIEVEKVLKDREEKLIGKETELNNKANELLEASQKLESKGRTLKEKEEYLDAKALELKGSEKMDTTKIENKMMNDIPENKGKKPKSSGKGAKK